MGSFRAAIASVSKETLYRYYSKKDDLFVDVLRSLTIERSFWVQAMERATEPRSTEDLRVLLRTTVQGLLETMMQPEYLAMLRLIVAESPRIPELGDLFRQALPEQGSRYFATLLRSAQRNGLIREGADASTVTRMFIGALLTYVLPNGLIQGTQPPHLPGPRAVDTFVDHIMDLISTRTRQ